MDWIQAVIGWFVFGLIAGGIARLLVPGKQELGCLGTVALGVVGSIIGGLIGSVLSGGARPLFHPAGWIGSIVCAIIILVIYTRRKKRIVP